MSCQIFVYLLCLQHQDRWKFWHIQVFWGLCFSGTWNSYKNLCCGIKDTHSAYGFISECSFYLFNLSPFYLFTFTGVGKVGWSRWQETERHINFHPYSFLLHPGNTPFPFHSIIFRLLIICYFFNVWEHFSFSFFVTNHFFNLEKYFRLLGQKIALKIQKHRFRVAKAMLLACKTSSFGG